MRKSLLLLVIFLSTLSLMGQNYCTPVIQCDWESQLVRFNSFGGIQDIQFSGGSCTPGGFSFESSDTIIVKRGEEVSFLAGGTGVTPFSIFTWIDFDKNGSYQEPGEYVYDQLNELVKYGTVAHGYKVEIPSNAPLGVTRMRVLLHQNLNQFGNYINNPPGSCVYPHGQSGNGQTRDFVIKIVDTLSCIQNPNSANIRAAEHYNCPGEPVTLYTRTGVNPGGSYQWLSSPTAGGPFTPDSGATAPVHTVYPTADRYYRLQINCGSQSFTTPTFHLVVRDEPLSGTYTINRLSGETNRNFRSLSKFARALSCSGVGGPITVNVENNSGPYRGEVSFIGVSNPNNHPVVINGNGQTFRPFRGINKQILAGGFVLFSKALRIFNTHHLTFNDVVFEVPSVNATHTVDIEGGSSNINFNESTFINERSVFNVFQLAVCNEVTIQNCSIIGGQSGIQSSFNHLTTNTIVDGCHFTNQDVENISAINFTGLTVENSSFTRTEPMGNSSFTSLLFEGSKLTVNQNRFYELAPINFNRQLTIISVEAQGNDSIQLTNNLIYGNHNRGNHIVFQLNTEYNVAPPFLLVHNTIYYNRTGGEKSLTWWRGVQFDDPTFSNGVIANNIWYINRETPNTQFYFGTLQAGNVTFDYNGFFHPTFNPSTMFFADVNGIKSVALSQWQQLSHDTNSVWVNPDFVAPGSDFKPNIPLLASSGLSFSLPTDVLQNPRSTTAPSIGAIEFSPPPGTDPVIEGMDADSIICSGPYPITIILNNYGGVTTDSVLIEMVKNGITTTHMISTTLEPGISTPVVIDVVNLTPSDFLNLEFTILESFPGPDLDTTNNFFSVTGLRTRMSGTYTVNRFLPNSGTNFTSHLDAVEALNTYGICGPVRIETAPFTGPYNEFLHLKSVFGSSPINTITFDGNDVIVNQSADFKNNTALWQIERGEYITIKNFQFNVTGNQLELFNTDILLISNRSKSIRILNNSFHFPRDRDHTCHVRVVGDKFISGFLPLEDTLIIENNQFSGGLSAVNIRGFNNNRSKYLRIRDNHVIYSKKNIIIFAFDEIEITNNVVTMETNYGFRINHATNVRFEKNGVFYNDLGEVTVNNIEAALFTDNVFGALDVLNNVVSLAGANTDTRREIYGFELGVDNNTVISVNHNTVALKTSKENFFFAGMKGVGISASQAHSIEIKNNIFYVLTTDNQAAFYKINNSPQTSQINSNVYYSVDGERDNVRMLDGTSIINGFETWQSIYGESDGLYTSPMFFDFNAQDLYPQSERIAQEATALSPPITTDYFDSIRKSPADPGAIEFEPLPCPGLLSQKGHFNDTVVAFRWEGTTKEVDLIYGASGFDTATAGTLISNTTTEKFDITSWQPGDCFEYYIRQHCHTGGTTSWEGPVEVCVPHAIDLGVMISSSNPLCHPPIGDLTMLVDVYNSGLQTVDNFTINFNTQGIVFVTDSVVINSGIAPGDTAQFAISIPGDTEEGGRLIFNVNLGVNSDGNTSNNIKGLSFYIIPFAPLPMHVTVCPNNTDSITLYARRLPGVGHAWFDIDTSDYRLFIHEGDTFKTIASVGDTFYLKYFNYPLNYSIISSFTFDEYFELNPNSAVSSSMYNPDVHKNEFVSQCYYPTTISHDPYLLARRCTLSTAVSNLNGASPSDAVFRTKINERWTELNTFSQTDNSPNTLGRSTMFDFGTPTFNSTGEIDFEMHLGRYSDGLGCGINQIRINSGLWNTQVAYQYITCSQALTPIVIVETPLPEAGFNFVENAMRGYFESTAENADSSYFEVITFGLGGKPGKRVEFDFPAVGNYLVCQYVYNDCGADTICEWIEIKNVRVSVDEETLNNLLTIFPNPSQGLVTLKADGLAFQPTEIRITDTYGNQVKSLYWDAPADGVKEYTFDLNAVSAGVYFIELRQGKAKTVKRWIKL